MPLLSIPTKLAFWLNASAFAAKSPLAETICPARCACSKKSIAISQLQEARLFELPATTQLASVLARLGRTQEGEARLHTIIDAFDTKHEIVDLAAARKVLDTLHR
jgi:hypothetical protein